MSLYYLSNTNSSLGGGNDFNKELLLSGATTGTITVALAASATEESYGYTTESPTNFAIPGNFSVRVNVTTANAQGRLSISLSRVNSSGTVQSTSSATGEQTTSAGVQTHTLNSVDLGTWASGDQLRVNYIFRNNNNMTQSLAISTGGTDDYVDVPWTAGLIDLEGSASVSAATSASLGITKTLADDISVSAQTTGAFIVNYVVAGNATATATALGGLEAYAELPAQPFDAMFNGAPFNELMFNSDPVGGQTQELAAGITVTANRTGALSVAKLFAAAPVVSVNTSAAVAVSKLLAAPVSVSGATSGSVGVGKTLASSVSVTAAVSGLAGVSIPIAATVSVSASASAQTLSLTQVLGAGLSVSGNTTGSVTKAANMAAALSATAVNSGAVTLTKPIAASAAVSASSTGDFNSGVALSGSVSSSAVTSAAMLLQVRMASAISVTATSTGAFQINKPLAVAGIVSATASANTSAVFDLAANASVLVSQSANLGVGKGLGGQLQVLSLVSGSAGIQIVVAANAQASASLNGRVVSVRPIDIENIIAASSYDALDEQIFADAELIEELEADVQTDSVGVEVLNDGQIYFGRAA